MGKKAKIPESNALTYLQYQSQQQVELAFSFEKKRTSPRGDSSLLPAGRLRPPGRQQTGYLVNPLGQGSREDRTSGSKVSLLQKLYASCLCVRYGKEDRISENRHQQMLCI